jgi:D-alanyl-lipoteichoic acid acyltransferase DltB (MBOAT superfamily)
MVFNSLVFLAFVVLFFPLYFGTRGSMRLWVCLIGSYFFYGWWDWRFLLLIAFSSLVDWFWGIWLTWLDDKLTVEQSTAKASPVYRGAVWLVQRLSVLGLSRKYILYLSIAINLGVLGFFKYFNFFADSMAGLLIWLGVTPSWLTLNIILPVGISFYTFQSMSYTIDIYRRQIQWEPSFLRFATFVSFFPQLVAGPIVRAVDFLPQMQVDRRFSWNAFNSGMGRIMWGFFKKVVVADSLAPFVDQVFDMPQAFSSAHLIAGVVFYSFQIYCDFSGYSDIAIGLARMLGFSFPENFRTPYFSSSFSEFWTRWHVSLSSWLRDYLYIPLGGNRHGVFQTYKNNMLTMLLGGLWHGANWAFVFWGLLHGLYLIAQRMVQPVWRRLVRALHLPMWINAGLSTGVVYLLTLLAWVYFRAGSVGLAGGDSFGTANAVLGGIFALDGLSPGTIINKFQAVKGFLVIGILLLVEISNFRYRWNSLQVGNATWRVFLFAVLLWLIAFFGTFGGSAFIYFQF